MILAEYFISSIAAIPASEFLAQAERISNNGRDCKFDVMQFYLLKLNDFVIRYEKILFALQQRRRGVPPEDACDKQSLSFLAR